MWFTRVSNAPYLYCGILLLAMILAGCDATVPAGDPYAAGAAGRATMEASQAQIQATKQAREGLSWQATMQAAQTQQSNREAMALLEAQGTATAQSLTGQMTATQAAWQQQATATQAMLAYLQTQPAATATAQAILDQTERERSTRLLRTYGGWALSALGIAGLGALFIVFLQFLRMALPWAMVRFFGVVQWGGKPVVIAPTSGGVGVIDYARALGPGTVLDRSSGQVTIYGHENDILQVKTTTQAQAAELLLAAGPGTANPRRVLAEAGRMGAGRDGGVQVRDLEIPLPPAPAWDLMRRWPGRSLLLGVGTEGLVVADPEATPHLLIAGTTGSGKTRFGLRPLICAALAGGWQVAVFDRSGLDFLPFEEHPNAQVVILEQAEQAIGYLEALYEEIRRRFELLARHGSSSWGRVDEGEDFGPRLLTVFDEFGNLADALPGREREELWRRARMVAAEGRKAGVHLALALQDPTHRSIDLRIRRNMAGLAFRVRDGDASRVVLNAAGAESLGEREFLATLDGSLVRGMAFAPSDEEIGAMLSERPVRLLGAPVWVNDPAVSTGDVGRPSLRARVRMLAEEGLSMNEIQRRVYGYTGGKAYEAVRGILAEESIGNRDGQDEQD